MNASVPPPAPVRTTCPYCGVGCGLRVAAGAKGTATVVGDPTHPANFGRICSKGATLGETISLEGRLLHPQIRQGETMVRTTWPVALDAVADGFKRIIERDGPDAVAFYLSGQLLTEDYYVANKLMKGFIGSANVDTNSRLCMASSVAGHRRAFGADTVPGSYADLDVADLIVLVGSNTAWCHPVLFQRMVQNRQERGAKIIVIDPRRTATCEEADLFLAVAPGTDTVLFSGLLVHLADRLALDFEFIDRHTAGFEMALVRAREIAPDAATTAQRCGLGEDDVQRFFDLFMTTEHAVTCYSQGVNQSAQGTDKVNAIINCHLATGRIGKPGMGPLSLTGQPNAMGGREVGGLANQLAAHMNFSPVEIDRVGRFWNAPHMAQREGKKAVAMFEAIARGEIKALWVMATNPAMSLPKAGAVRDALKKLDLLVISENVEANDTVNAGAHVLLPAAAWGEKDGTVTNSERRISRQRAFLPLPGEARPDWWIVNEAARRMGFGDAFDYRNAADVFREHAALSAFENDGTRDFDIGAFAHVSDAEFDGLGPVQWPAPAGAPAKPTGDKRFFASGRFFTPDHKGRFIAPELPELREATTELFPLRLNTGRVRDQWHSMTRSGRSARLAAHMPEPFVEVHPDDARMARLVDNGFAHVATAHGACVLKVMICDRQQPGSVFVPIHWSDATASSARIGELVAPHTDPHSGQPEAKATPAALAPVDYPLRGFVRSRRPLDLPRNTWWTRIAIADFFGSELRIATDRDLMFWQEFAHDVLAREGEIAEFHEPGLYRAVVFVDGEFDACLSVGIGEAAQRWDALKAVIAAGPPTDSSASVTPLIITPECADHGPVVCACFGVGEDAIRDAVRAGADSVPEIGRALSAGTNCGSCLPELKRLVARARASAAA
jgi:assimilatory nitrate reductase catalytic subunit